MEDAIIVEPDFFEDFSLYAVFDGHGGKIRIFIKKGNEVAKFAKKNFVPELLKN
jgi:protein phosphatase 1G